jgi:GTP cyclohydrolase I
MTVNDVFKWLDAFAPFETQDEYDNAGLLVGDPSTQVTKILFSLDATRAVAAEAAKINANLIIVHHPLMFNPIQSIRYDRGEGAVIRALTASGISLIAAHTNLDICAGGIADSLAEVLALDKSTACGDCPYLRTGTLSAPRTAKEFLGFVNSRLSASARLYGDPDTLVRTVAVVPGAGGGEYIHAEADVFLTGEIKYHELLDAIDRGLIVIDAGHYPTEFSGISALYKRFLAAASTNNWAVEAELYGKPLYPCTAHG